VNVPSFKYGITLKDRDTDIGWMSDGACVDEDPDLWFPEKGKPTEAKLICACCQVRDRCLDYAIEHNEVHGIWAGTTEKDRRRIRRERT
jgi:WhiB family redox-sensing transcriptional regulator